jgi:NAD(P)H dehydrogenase (quinone)
VQSIENILGLFGVSFVQRSDIRSAGLAVQGKPDKSALSEAKALGRKLGEAGVSYRCGLGKRAIEVGPKP